MMRIYCQLDLVDDIRWLFATGGVGQFTKMKNHTYRDLTVEFLSTLHVDVTRGPQCQVGYISFYLQGQFYELNLRAFNKIFGFPPGLDLSLREVPFEFNPNGVWDEISRNFNYNTSSCKGTFIRNPYIRLAQRIFLCGIFAGDDSVKVPPLSELCFLSCMIDGVRVDPMDFLAR